MNTTDSIKNEYSFNNNSPYFVFIKPTFHYKRVSYHLPIPEVGEEIFLNSAQISMNGRSFITKEKKGILFRDQAPIQSIRISCTDWKIDEQEHATVYVLLYKEGQAEPIQENHDYLDCYSSIDLELKCDREQLEPGSYFFYFPFAKHSSDLNYYKKVESGLCFPFQIMPIGTAEKCPRLGR